jgi:hypothetical protein
MLLERRGRSSPLNLDQPVMLGGVQRFSGRRHPSCDGTSRMMREYQVRFCERFGVKLPGPPRQPASRALPSNGSAEPQIAVGIDASRTEAMHQSA